MEIADKYMKTFSISLAIMEMKTKTSIKYHLIPVKNGYYQKDKKVTNTRKVWEKGNPYTLLVECKLVQSLQRIVWRLLKKLKTDLPYDPAIPLLNICLKEMKSAFERYSHFHVHCSSIHNSQWIMHYSSFGSFKYILWFFFLLFVAFLYILPQEILNQPRCPLMDEQ